MEQTVIKTELGSNGEILLYYVNENGITEQAVLSGVESYEHHDIQFQESGDGEYILSDALEVEDGRVNAPLLAAIQQEAFEDTPQPTVDEETWLEDEIKRLMVFYNDNKQTFKVVSQKTHLWTVACKTILIGKNPTACESQLLALKIKYTQLRSHLQRGIYINWPYFELCHQAFQDEESVMLINLEDSQTDQLLRIPAMPKLEEPRQENIAVVKKTNNCKNATDEQVETMLNLYLRHKKEYKKQYWTRGLWETISIELGEDDVEYWHKRFLNYKQHYIRILEKRKATGCDSSNWPYTALFDEIFADDEEFQRKYANDSTNSVPDTIDDDNYWNDTENIVLIKYCFDCFDEFQDTTIPDSFLWNEIGRLLAKSPDKCKEKYEELKKIHLDKYIEGGYSLRTRKPISLLFDYLISKEIEVMMVKDKNNQDKVEIWKSEELDEMVQFFYDNIEMFKDSLCYFVCWLAVSKKLGRTVFSCHKHWQELKELYKSILDDKKENSDMQIDWRYIELFDRLFDYGMDTNLLTGYEQFKEAPVEDISKVGARKVNIKSPNNAAANGDLSKDDDSNYEEPSKKNKLNNSKIGKILEFYMKNKVMLSKPGNKTQWTTLAKQIGMTIEQCISKLRNIKRQYVSFVRQEIEKPGQVKWPYYKLCKKVFGYRAIKSQIKNKKLEADTAFEDWDDSDIKKMINYFSQHFDEINSNIDDTSKWAELASTIDKTEFACKDKFLELRKSYRKLRTRSRNPDVKISWKYFHAIDQIYMAREDCNYEFLDEELDKNDGDTSVEPNEEDDYQCIIVIPEGQDLNDISDAQIIMKKNSDDTTPNDSQIQEIQNPEQKLIKWTKRTKKRLLILYINYLRSHKGKEIVAKEMWKEISSKLRGKTSVSCRKMFTKLKANHTQLPKDDGNANQTPYYMLMQKILAIKPRFAKSTKNKVEGKVFKDIDLPVDKVESALNYYLQHIEEFASPKFEKKYLWTELANFVSEPVSKVYNKINFLKHSYNNTELLDDMLQFSEVLKEISAKVTALTLVTEVVERMNEDFNENWTDEETEQLLEWYLSNLDKFKNPKFVRRYLWMEVSNILHKSPLGCSKKMSEIRTQYRNMVREKSEQLNAWRFYDLCQKIYGTGKKENTVNEN